MFIIFKFKNLFSLASKNNGCFHALGKSAKRLASRVLRGPPPYPPHRIHGGLRPFCSGYKHQSACCKHPRDTRGSRTTDIAEHLPQRYACIRFALLHPALRRVL